ncbi:galactose oxidase [Aspergillus cavernicola]|uniref:Galactose oxidase n=1 Tax=Aspergillus cavernicola TaxID=176166 RepID=A0ABR4HJY6_9EURO
MGLNKWITTLLLLGIAEARNNNVEGSVIAAVANVDGPTMESGSPQNAGGEDTGLWQAPPFNSHRLDRKNWTVTCDSAGEGNVCANAIDGSNATFWLSGYTDTSNVPPPHTITVNLHATVNVSGLGVWPRQDGSQMGWIADHQVFVSLDGTDWGTPVAYGSWWPDSTVKLSVFEPRRAQFVRLVALSEANGNPWTSIADLQVWGAASIPAPPTGQNLHRTGVWGPTIDFPIVPVSAAVEPGSRRLLVWSAYRKNQYGGTTGGLTQTSTWDPVSGSVTRREVAQTHHDMFCSGISMDMNGRIIITGGNDDDMTSIYDSFADEWIEGEHMIMERGYQSSTLLSDGNMFVIGGSWNGGEDQNKYGELYHVGSDTWTSLPGAAATPLLTNDALGPYHADNHPWLFGWKNRSIYQAGPSKAMHWYFVEGQGSVTDAGGRGADNDQMSGSAVMFDAAHGRILTAGGSPNYEDSDATNHASLVTIGDPNTLGQVQPNNMIFSRVFHTSVVLPDGSVFLTGGQSHSTPFIEKPDSNQRMTPELYVPGTNQFELKFPNNIVRVYHSWSLLMPDATVINGGGGLCANCSGNHYDAQIYTPGYLFDTNGARAPRPEIRSVSPNSVHPGGQITIQTSVGVASASLVRYGSTTHTVNTDQRRIALELTTTSDRTYTATIPNDAGIALPGYYMLFVMDANGVPSVSSNVQVIV